MLWVTSWLDFFPKGSNRPPLKTSLVILIICQAFKRKKFLWLARECAGMYGLRLIVNPSDKTWKIVSKPMWNPEEQRRDYSDILSIFKSDLRSFTTTEEHDEAGHLKRFTVQT